MVKNTRSTKKDIGLMLDNKDGGNPGAFLDASARLAAKGIYVGVGADPKSVAEGDAAIWEMWESAQELISTVDEDSLKDAPEPIVRVYKAARRWVDSKMRWAASERPRKIG